MPDQKIITDIDELTDEERLALATHIYNAKQIEMAVIGGSMGLPANDVISGCIGAINAVAMMSPEQAFRDVVAAGLKALALHLTGECGCDEHAPASTPPAGTNLH